MPTEAAENQLQLSLFVAVGPRLTCYALTPSGTGLTAKSAIVLPSRVQYAWPHPTFPILYLACADRTPGAEGSPFHLCALDIRRPDNLSLIGEPIKLLSRPIHLTTDPAGNWVLVAYSSPSALTMHRLKPDGSIEDDEVDTSELSTGHYPHQVRVTPSGDRAIIVARGKKGFGEPGYQSGQLTVLELNQGKLRNLYSVLPRHSALDGFNPRHLDFHPSLPLMFVALEEQNLLCTFRIKNGEIEDEPAFVTQMLRNPEKRQPRQDGGTVHVHPNGRYVYVANRNDGYIGGHKGPSWLTPDPVPVFPGGENNIAVFEIDQTSGEPRLIQNEDSRGLHPRTFSLDPAGGLLVAGNIAPTIFDDGQRREEIPANLALFRVEDEGILSFVRRHDIDVEGEMIWWCGFVG